MLEKIRENILFIRKFWLNENSFRSEIYLRYSLLSIIIYSVWAIIYPRIDNNFHDGFWERFIVTSILGLPVLSSVCIFWKNKTVELFFTLLLTGGVIHHHFLTILNNLHPIYIAGTILALSAVQIMLNSFRSFFTFSITILLFDFYILIKFHNSLALFWFLAELTITVYSFLSLSFAFYSLETNR